MKIKYLVLGLCAMNVAHANLPAHFVDASTLPGFNTAVQAAGGKVMFPSAVLKQSDIYVSGEVLPKGGYTIYLNYTADCGVAAYCNLGRLEVQPATGPLVMYQNRTHQIMTKMLALQDKTPAAYTQGYAMADYWPPHLDWISQGMLYSLIYSNAHKNDLVWMANHMQMFTHIASS